MSCSRSGRRASCRTTRRCRERRRTHLHGRIVCRRSSPSRSFVLANAAGSSTLTAPTRATFLATMKVSPNHGRWRREGEVHFQRRPTPVRNRPFLRARSRSDHLRIPPEVSCSRSRRKPQEWRDLWRVWWMLYSPMEGDLRSSPPLHCEDRITRRSGRRYLGAQRSVSPHRGGRGDCR